MQASTFISYTKLQKLSTIFAMLCLLWLTVSTPYVNNYQQQVKKELQQTADDGLIDGNSTEEKNESGNDNVTEYLNQWLSTYSNPMIGLTFHSFYTTDVYPAFHPETVVPPPDNRLY